MAPANARAGPSRQRASSPIEDSEAETSRRPRRGEQTGHTNGVAPSNGSAPANLTSDGWTIDTFKSLPLAKTGVVSSVFRNLDDRLKDTLGRVDDGLDKTREAAKAFEDAQEDDPAVEELDAAFRRLLEVREELRIKIRVLTEMAAELRQEGELVDPDKIYQERAIRATKEYRNKSQRAKFQNLPEYQDFRAQIWEINHPDDACPPVSRWLPKERDEESDEDIEIGATTQTYRCPITLLQFVEPVTSNKCRHSYSRAAVEGLIATAQGKRAVKCPVAGCMATIEKKDLEINRSLAKRTAEHAKRLQRRQEEEEEDPENLLDLTQE
ncbi:hypothetical protein TREMEDRAFT_59831 [Tremella mesenterica DSM 1558]|uniref:uncharacterized protein n=1 Tax=Tremella mesenterica (strain ATCC 24925 / CBS 8224 / DSM 1558 / NBRC 9311 / NRRL Y-6157 / RJB 2259-6 / UBC 559-6) TaxID=578456 RepID=UPI0003F49AD3|nr:uncharacterized protein TREMEDRAFT_59831 [Tremella mesenterica DSM 1558]EIW73658.1 hypothetical protein TREMEDRAFT_59831 [Tremella mesenterica DSM 1558]